MTRPLTDRERCLQLEGRVAELEEELAAWKGQFSDEARDEAHAERVRKVQAFLRRGYAQAGGAGPAAILLWLVDHPGVLATKARLIDVSRQPGAHSDREPEGKVVEVQVCKIRHALEGWDRPRSTISTVRGRGYLMEHHFAVRLKAEMLGEGADG